jgi:hypothetical protein
MADDVETARCAPVALVAEHLQERVVILFGLQARSSEAQRAIKYVGYKFSLFAKGKRQQPNEPWASPRSHDPSRHRAATCPHTRGGTSDTCT